MLDKILPFLKKPTLFEPGTDVLWTDDHISKGMLEAHLHPSQDAATRNHAFVAGSVAWLAAMLPPARFPCLLDLGCGPGIYAEAFCAQGYSVTGVDISRRSVEYAAGRAREKGLAIRYRQESYLELEDVGQYDLAALIFCDFGVLPTDDRRRLLGRVFRALKPRGYFVFDGFTPRKYAGKAQERTWQYQEAGFFRPAPYLSLDSFYRYDEDRTFLNQHIVVTEQEVACFNIWEHTFTREELEEELRRAGFSSVRFFDDIAGAPYTGKRDTICVVAGRG